MKQDTRECIKDTLMFFSGFVLVCTIIGIPLGIWVISKKN